MIDSYVSDGQWAESPVFRNCMCMTYGSFLTLCVTLLSGGFMGDTISGLNGQVQGTLEFRVAISLYYLGHGGTLAQTADVAGIGMTSVQRYVDTFCKAVQQGLKPQYMPGGTSVNKQAWIRAKFAERRGIRCVIMTVDGTHVPWIPDNVC